ncbi:MAG: TetR/AcrR family transcriptional regulator [Candidatus Marinimicrobia bacterium]|nr:TetR/AcrR family transcriptional regulator [Candidatus Neomarinimicrobiota bacterium]
MNENSDKTTLSRKERDRIRNKETIMEAAVHLFAQKGFNETKLEEVAALAEFGKGTIYNYFENKHDLLISTFDFALCKMANFLEKQLNEVKKPMERLRLIVESQFEYYRNHEDFLRVIIANQSVISQCVNEESGSDLHLHFMHLRKLMVHEIQAAMDLGEMKPGNANRYASYLSGMIHGQIRSLNQGELDIDEVHSDEIFDIFYTGVKHA